MKKLFMILPLVFLFCFTFGCQDKKAMAELETMKAQAAVEEQNKELVRKVMDSWNNKNFEFIMEVNAPGYSYYNPPENPNPMSTEELIEMMKMFWEGIPDLTFTVEESMAEGGKVISRIIARGTHEGELQGIPATGKEIEISVFNIIRIKNGKIVEEWELADNLNLYDQLGMKLKRKEGEK